jgi:Protein ENHANCED DISEASE RESISTANCE 2, C-terminal
VNLCIPAQAIALLQRLAAPHPDPACNAGIRQQVKMIARVANPVEWHKSGKLSRTELRLLESYNAKPVLMRPCQRFYRGANYLEIDFDLHSFSFFARKVRHLHAAMLLPWST